MTFGDVWQDWGLDTSKDESRKILDAFTEAGGNFIDTANKYNEGQSEATRRSGRIRPSRRADGA